MTKRKKDPAGTLVRASCGAILEVSDVGCRDGTTVIVEELFHNVPARRKFLKRDVSEAMAVAAVVEKIALSRPDIAIRFLSENQEKMNTGRATESSKTPFMRCSAGILQSGCFGYTIFPAAWRWTAISDSPDNVRANRNYQNFFINGTVHQIQNRVGGTGAGVFLLS